MGIGTSAKGAPPAASSIQRLAAATSLENQNKACFDAETPRKMTRKRSWSPSGFLVYPLSVIPDYGRKVLSSIFLFSLKPRCKLHNTVMHENIYCNKSINHEATSFSS